MTANELNELVGKVGWLETDAGMFPARVVDARENFGRVDVRVRPANLKPRADHPWVQAGRFHEDPAASR